MPVRLNVSMFIQGDSKQNPEYGSNQKDLVFYRLQTSTCRGKLKTYGREGGQWQDGLHLIGFLCTHHIWYAVDFIFVLYRDDWRQ